MTPEDRMRLDQIEALLVENNKMIKAIRNSGRYTLYARIAYWVIILALVYGVYAYTGPVLNGLVDQYKDSFGVKKDVQVIDQVRRLGQ